MSIAERRERQRAERYELILATACELAEAEGWDAVTTRRLAGLIDYSQPVLYSHFKGKADIMAAVATRGFEELATRLRSGERPRRSGHPAQRLRRLSRFCPFAAGYLRGDVRPANQDQVRQRGNAARSSRRLRRVGRRPRARSARAGIFGRSAVERIARTGRARANGTYSRRRRRGYDWMFSSDNSLSRPARRT